MPRFSFTQSLLLAVIVATTSAITPETSFRHLCHQPAMTCSSPSSNAYSSQPQELVAVSELFSASSTSILPSNDNDDVWQGTLFDSMSSTTSTPNTQDKDQRMLEIRMAQVKLQEKLARRGGSVRVAAAPRDGCGIMD